MANFESELDRGDSLRDTTPSAEKLYTRLLALLSICAFGAAGVVSIIQVLWRPAFSRTKPDFHGALSAGLMGLGLVFGSFHTYAQGKRGENPKLGVPGRYLILLLAGILELCFAGFIAWSDFKALGY
jgi:hypothetical protein